VPTLSLDTLLRVLSSCLQNARPLNLHMGYELRTRHKHQTPKKWCLQLPGIKRSISTLRRSVTHAAACSSVHRIAPPSLLLTIRAIFLSVQGGNITFTDVKHLAPTLSNELIISTSNFVELEQKIDIWSWHSPRTLRNYICVLNNKELQWKLFALRC